MLMLRVVDVDAGTDEIVHDRDLAGPGFEGTQTHRAGVHRHLRRIDRGDTEHREEDPALPCDLDDKSEGTRTTGADTHDHVPDPADGLAVCAEQDHTGQSTGENSRSTHRAEDT